MTREEVQAEALSKLIQYNGGTVVLAPGTGKSKVAIDFAIYKNAKKVLITSPRTNLKDSWTEQLILWVTSKNRFDCDLINIQTCYKWSKEEIIRRGYDLIIFDEIHTIVTEEYGELVKNAKRLDITSVGLTGTPDDRKPAKFAFYALYCPIIYRYLDSAKDGIINKRKYIVYHHELDDAYQIEVKTKTSSWKAGEKKQYDYIQSQVEKGENLIKDILEIPRDTEEYVNYFGYANSWYWQGTGNAQQKLAGGTYMRAVTARKDLLWRLSSTATIAELMATYIIANYKDSKVLVFSERTEQASSISNYCVHSKQKDDVNAKILDDFNKGIIRQLGSCYSLTLGLNLNNAGYAIMESYNGSSVQFKQRSGRVDRLPVTDNAIVIFIVVNNTQSEKWFNESVKFSDDDIVKHVSNFDEFTTALKSLK